MSAKRPPSEVLRWAAPQPPPRTRAQELEGAAYWLYGFKCGHVVRREGYEPSLRACGVCAGLEDDRSDLLHVFDPPKRPKRRT